MTPPDEPDDADGAAADTAAASEAGEAPPERGLAAVEPGPAQPSGAPATLEEQLAAARAEIAGLKEQLLRRRADFENYRRRVERDRQSVWHETAADIFGALVPTLDNLDRALASAAPDDPLREGVALIERELLALLEGRGVSVEDPTGRHFDPERHQALSHEVVAGASPGTVVETFRKGYLFKDRLLRPALVKVAKDEAAEGGEKSELLH